MRYTVFFLVLLTCVLAGAVMCLSGPSPKATGAGEFTRIEDGVEIPARFDFNAHGECGNRPAKGWFKYHDSLGNEFTIDVQCVTVFSNEAVFSGPVVKTNMSDWEGMWLVVWVEDGGSPADGNDSIGGEMYEYDPGCDSGTAPSDYWPVTNGNIVVH